MTSKTTRKALRLNISNFWENYSFHEKKEYHLLDRKLKAFFSSIIEVFIKEPLHFWFFKTGNYPLNNRYNTTIESFQQQNLKNSQNKYRIFQINNIFVQKHVLRALYFPTLLSLKSIPLSLRSLDQKQNKSSFLKKKKDFSQKSIVRKSANKQPQKSVKTLQRQDREKQKEEANKFSFLEKKTKSSKKTKYQDTLNKIERKKFHRIQRRNEIAKKMTIFKANNLDIKPNQLFRFYKKDNNAPIIMGKCTVLKSPSIIYIHLGYFFDIEYHSSVEVNSLLVYRVLASKQYIERVLNVKLKLSLNNYYLFFWKLKVYTSRYNQELINREKAKQIIREANFFRVKQDQLQNLMQDVRKWSKNRYFQRTIQAIVPMFFFEFDTPLVANLIAFELGNLRKGHGKYLNFVKQILTFCFKSRIQYNRRSTNSKPLMNSVVIRVQGRITKSRRPSTRTQTVNLRAGRLNLKKNDVKNRMDSYEAQSYNRFGIINIEVITMFNH